MEHQNGTSPIVHLSLVEHPSHDPAYHALWTTVCDARNHIPKAVGTFILDKLVQANDRQKPEVGPCSVLLFRLRQILWSWEGNTFVDHRGLEIDIWEVCIQELAVRLAESWQDRVARDKAWRKTFGGMDDTFPKLANHDQKLAPQQASILRNNQNGTFFTADHLNRAQGQSTNCLFVVKKIVSFIAYGNVQNLKQHVSSVQKVSKKNLNKCLRALITMDGFPYPRVARISQAASKPYPQQWPMV